MEHFFEIVSQIIGGNRQITEVPEGYCPGCWGRQEYGGKFYDAIFEEKITVNNLSEKRGWISAYVQENLEGIKLNTQTATCPSCQISYKEI